MVVWISSQTPELTQAVPAGLGRLRSLASHRRCWHSRVYPNYGIWENATEEHPRFMHFYELDAADPETICYQMMHPIVGARLRRLRHSCI